MDHTLKVRGLSPRAWLNRCASVWPEYAGQAYDGLTSEDGQGLLKALTERFEAFDEYIGRCPVTLDPSFVATTRTLLGSLKKFREPYGDEEELTEAAIARFRLNNGTAAAGQIPRRFEGAMRRFLKVVLDDYGKLREDPERGLFLSDRSSPRFGPGAVCERLSILDRWEYVADFDKNRLYDFRWPDDTAGWGSGDQSGLHSRLCAVPKDWNKKRLITVEPTLLSYLQHYTRRNLWRCLARCKVAGLRRLATPHQQDPQAVHRMLARRGSMEGTLATLDLSDASDLVSFNQVAKVMPAHVMADLERSRSDLFAHPSTPDILEPLYMYGGMGNATTFTVETLMFHAMCYAVADYFRLGFKDSFISCYGDDMIVSTRLAELLIEQGIFAEFGWRINAIKSYWRPTSRFRESCGGQFYNGHDVTLLRYQGGYNGLEGVIAYRELIHRCRDTARWRRLVYDPWMEQNIPNSGSWVAEGALITSVPWWPDTASLQTRRNSSTWEVEAWLPQLRIPKRVHPVHGLGPVYGALSGQLTEQSGSRRYRGRRVHGIVVPVLDRMTVANSWQTVGEVDWVAPHFGHVPGIRKDSQDDDLVMARLRRRGQI